VIWVVALAALAAFLFARAAFLQQQGLGSALDAAEGIDAFGIARQAGRMVRNRVWLLGWVTNLAGFMSQAAALYLGSVAVVQPVLTSQLLFTLALVSWHRRRRPPVKAWLGAVAISGGLAILVAVEGAAPLAGDADRGLVLGAAAAAVLAVGTLLVVARRSRLAPLLSAVAAGICFTMTAVFMKLTTEDLVTKGVGGTAVDWPGYFLAVSTASGLLIEQAAFANGPLTSAIAAMNITNPLASYVVGTLAFQAALPTSPGPLAAASATGLLLVVGVLALAHVPAIREQAGGAGADDAAEAERTQ